MFVADTTKCEIELVGGGLSGEREEVEERVGEKTRTNNRVALLDVWAGAWRGW